MRTNNYIRLTSFRAREPHTKEQTEMVRKEECVLFFDDTDEDSIKGAIKELFRVSTEIPEGISRRTACFRPCPGGHIFHHIGAEA